MAANRIILKLYLYLSGIRPYRLDSYFIVIINMVCLNQYQIIPLFFTANTFIWVVADLVLPKDYGVMMMARLVR